MTLPGLSLAGLRGARLTSALNILVMALGLGAVTLLVLFSASLTDRLVRDARGIDLVVGAKGSPLQLVLSSVYQADVPTGNIPLSELETLSRSPMVARAVPLALGDAVGSFRIVGTDASYIALYGAQLAQGRQWQAPMEAVLGAEAARHLRLDPGAHFIGAHGVNGEGFHHDHAPYTVTGILAPTGSVIDRLVLTSLDSVWAIHDHPGSAPASREVTAILLQARTPLAIVSLPHQINAATPFQAAIPSFEAARLFSLLGFGLQAFRILAALLIATSGLGMLVALVTRLRERMRDVAMLRLLGASRGQVVAIVLIESLIVAGSGAVAGLLLGHAGAWSLSHWVQAGNALASISPSLQPGELWVPGLALGVGCLAAALPAAAAYRCDVAAVLGDANG